MKAIVNIMDTYRLLFLAVLLSRLQITFKQPFPVFFCPFLQKNCQIFDLAIKIAIIFFVLLARLMPFLYNDNVIKHLRQTRE